MWVHLIDMQGGEQQRHSEICEAIKDVWTLPTTWVDFFNTLQDTSIDLITTIIDSTVFQI